MTASFVPVTTEVQQEQLAQLAAEIWNEYWPALIGQAQTDYMVEQFQSLSAIQRDMARAEHPYEYWFVYDAQGNLAGYTGGYEEPETNRFFISKIYLAAPYRGKHLASDIVAHYVELCYQRKLAAMYLTVNKGNELGIRCYKGKGFETIDAPSTDIGNGFVMDDYVMEKRMAPADMRLIVMDIDSTLINEEVIDLLGEEAGVGERVADITERAMRGELDFAQALHERVSLLTGLDDSVFQRTFDRVTFTPGAHELIDEAHARGWKVGVVSGGFHEVADRIVSAANIDYCLANRLESKDGKLTGNLAADIVTKDRKLQALRTWSCNLGLPMAQTVAMGDGANDIPMIQAAGTGIAFCAKPKTAAAAPYRIDERNLALALDIINGASAA